MTKLDKGTTIDVGLPHYWPSSGKRFWSRLMEQRQLPDPFGFLVYAELAGAELSPVR